MATMPTPLFRQDDQGRGLPVSARIRERLVRAGQRFHANDNIAAYLQDGEIEDPDLRREFLSLLARKA